MAGRFLSRAVETRAERVLQNRRPSLREQAWTYRCLRHRADLGQAGTPSASIFLGGFATLREIHFSARFVLGDFATFA
jgi:hypothetical protein